MSGSGREKMRRKRGKEKLTPCYFFCKTLVGTPPNEKGRALRGTKGKGEKEEP